MCLANGVWMQPTVLQNGSGEVFNHRLVIPGNAEEALSGPQAAQWKKAMEDELHNMRCQDTWETVQRPKDRNVVGAVSGTSQ